MYEEVHEQISVAVCFKKGTKPKITSFVWRENRYDVEEVHLVSRARKGRECVWIFNVSTKSSAFKIRLDTDTLSWYLEELTWETNKEGIL